MVSRYEKRQADRKNTCCKICNKPLEFQYKLALKYCSDSCRSVGDQQRQERKFHARQMKKYNLSKEEYSKIMAIKNCEICGTDKDLCIDHCHDTGKVRGRLCMHCNTALGKFNHDPELIRRTIAYIKGEL